MHLPESKILPTHLLSACFNKTSATYKYYWLLSILQSVENGNSIILKKELFARMISNSWYTVNYFNVSFGKQDLIQTSIYNINRLENITIDEKRDVVFQKLISSKNAETNQILWHFDKNVPHWFLSPWFPKTNNETNSERMKRIYIESNKPESICLYNLQVNHIEINTIWKDYLTSNSRMLKDFCYWNLALFLQNKNPNVPDLPNKLIKAAKRNNLIKQRTQFWDLVLDEIGEVNCIYTGKSLKKGDYAVEHFIPYSFVSHDLIWNLIPADKSYNSSKGNRLPKLDKYFDSFFSLQKTAFDIVFNRSPNNKILQDYHTIFPNLENSLSKEKFKDIIQPLISIASNNGFEYMQ